MPQLDTFMYLSQVFWLLVLFTVFYILVLNNILPNISRVLKLRRKKISSEGSSVFSEEHNSVMVTTSNVLEESLINSTTSLSKTRISTFDWLEVSLKEANEKTLLDLNKTYLKNIGELKGQSLLITDIIKQK
jgi:F-type H+-transporting ATPase subunit b|tara:strand:- start:2209 stop:2604 length:396 start_codon:yes stop_codon:yes gene_type:complete